MAKFGFSLSDQPLLKLVTETTPVDTHMSHALRYADLGWYVLPVRQDKKPVDGYGLNSCTRDPALIRKIWTEHPMANIAVACERSGLVVLDIDPRNGGTESLARLESEHGIIYSAVVSRTQGGGEHRVFKAGEHDSYPGTLGAGLDIKHRGYILVEPSRGESGIYQWQAGKNPTQGTLPSETPSIMHSSSRANLSQNIRNRPGSVVVSQEIYSDLSRALQAIPPDIEYSKWFKVLQGLSRLSDTAEAYRIASEWSTRSRKPTHTEQALKEKWRSLMREDSEVSHLSVFHEANLIEPNWNKNAPRPPHVIDTLEEFNLQPLTRDELKNARLSPRVVVPFMLYADVRTRIAAGGVGKTTLALYEAITLALCRELWGRQPERPVRTVLVTREDARETLVARMREIMKELNLDSHGINQVLENVLIMDLSSVGYRISAVVGDVVIPHADNLEWLIKHLRGFKPDWIIMDPLVSFGVGEQRVNDAEQGLIEAMRIVKKEFDCCVEGIHHSGKANAREKTLDQYSGRGGSALADGARMVCVLAPLSPNEWLERTGDSLSESESGMVMAMPKMSYCRAQSEIYIKRSGYLFSEMPPLVRPARADVERQIESSVYGIIHEHWLKNTPLSMQDLRDGYKAMFYNSLKRDEVMDALSRLKRDGRVRQTESKGGRGIKAVLEPIITERGEPSQYAIPS